jgi:hypothetical protein
MNKTFLAVLVTGLIAIAIGAAIWSTRAKPHVSDPALPDFDYASPASWAVKPGMPPPAVWETDWEIDVLVLSQSEALKTGDAQELEKQSRKADEEIARLAGAFGGIGPVYAPFLRADSYDEDLTAALTQYLSTDNRGRAFIVATDAPLPAVLTGVFAADTLLRDRFGGVLMYGDEPAEGMTLQSYASGLCSRRFDSAQGCVVPVDLRRAGARYEMSGAEALTGGFVGWLRDNASRLAEPLGDLEEIEIIEIQKPPEPE